MSRRPETPHLSFQTAASMPAWQNRLLLALLLISSSADAWQSTGIDTLVTRLAPEVERLVERSKPEDWQIRRACLYYALAGQRLLAESSISADLRVGAVLYAPASPHHHSIHPHFWLETPTHLIDFSTLPRWGHVSLIPLPLVARAPWEIRPGFTSIAVAPIACETECRDFLSMHRRRFQRAMENLP